MDSSIARNAVSGRAAWRALLGLLVFLCPEGARAGVSVVTAATPPAPKPMLIYQSSLPYAMSAPMRMARENSARTPPLLPRTVVKATPTPTPSVTPKPTATPVPVSNVAVNMLPSITVKVESPLIEATDFFQAAARHAEGDGTIFDPTFRPAVPPPQPVSSATYQLK